MTLTLASGLLLLFGTLIFSADASGAESAPMTNGLTAGGIFYPANSLGYALETNYFARTNAIRHYNPGADQPWTKYEWGNTNVARYRLNTNSLIYGKRGATAISVAQFNMTANRLCLLTKRHAVGAGHYSGVTNGLIVWFIGTNNLVHGMVVSNTFFSSPVTSSEDREIITFTRDVPDDVQPMRIAAPLTNGTTGDIYALVERYFPAEAQNPYRPRAGFWVCQHGYCGRNAQPHPSGIIGSNGGDSGSPGFIILGDECVNIGGICMNAPTASMVDRMNILTRSLGLDTNQYQPQYVWLTNYPAGPY